MVGDWIGTTAAFCMVVARTRSTAAHFTIVTLISAEAIAASRPTAAGTVRLAVLSLLAGPELIVRPPEAALITLQLEAAPLVESVAAAKPADILPVAELASAGAPLMAVAASTVEEGVTEEAAGIRPVMLHKIR